MFEHQTAHLRLEGLVVDRKEPCAVEALNDTIPSPAAVDTYARARGGVRGGGLIQSVLLSCKGAYMHTSHPTPLLAHMTSPRKSEAGVKLADGGVTIPPYVVGREEGTWTDCTHMRPMVS